MTKFDPRTWRGKNSFCCGGKVILASNKGLFGVIFIHISLIILLIAFTISEAFHYGRYVSILIPIIFYILIIIVWSLLFLAEFTVPRFLLSISVIN